MILIAILLHYFLFCLDEKGNNAIGKVILSDVTFFCSSAENFAIR